MELTIPREKQEKRERRILFRKKGFSLLLSPVFS